MVRPTTQHIDPLKIPPPSSSNVDLTKFYSFASLSLLVLCSTNSLNVQQYVTLTRKFHIAHLPWFEAKATTAFLNGDTDECELLMSTILSVDKQSSRSTKRKKTAELTATTLVQLQQTATQANTSFTLANSPFSTIDYITLMKNVYNEAFSTYLDSTGTKRKADKLDPKSEQQQSTITTTTAAVAVAAASAAARQAATTQFKPENPIIIVPAGQTLTFSFKNFGDLLAHGKYIKATEPDDMFKIKPDIAPDNSSLSRQIASQNTKRLTRPSISRPGAVSTFELCSDPESLSTSQWNRVVGVVITGKTYQLEPFTPYKGSSSTGGQINTPALFENIAGFYLYFDGDKIPPSIQQWNVSTHKFSLSKRHQDEIVMSEVWERIIQMCKKRQRTNPNLFF